MPRRVLRNCLPDFVFSAGDVRTPARACSLTSALALALLAAGCGARAPECVRVASWAEFRELALEAEVVDSFRVRHPEIPVCLESLEGAGIYREKILTSIAAGTPPGVFLQVVDYLMVVDRER